MEKIRFLLEQYKKGVITEDEKKSLLNALQVNENALHDLLQKEFDKSVEGNEQLLSSEKSEEIFKKILAEKSRPERERQVKKTVALSYKKMYKGAAAACIAGVLFWSLNTFLSGKKTQVRNVVVRVKDDKKQNHTKRIENTENTVIASVLEDGTKIWLSPKSSIVYDEQAFDSSRTVALNGRAKFKVKHNAKHPFSVNVNGIIITDVGTVFSVKSFNDKVQVKLFEGKVMIHSSRKELAMKDTYLKQGEQFSLSVINGNYDVSHFEKRDIHASVKEKNIPMPVPEISIDSLIFNQTPLQEVFDKMGKMYNRQINYDIKDIKAMSFSGLVNRKDSLQIMLKVICTTNDLNFKDSTGNIFIYK